MQMADAEEEDNVNRNGSELKKTAETAVAPWVGYNEEETMKAQILALSKVVATLSLTDQYVCLSVCLHISKTTCCSVVIARSSCGGGCNT